MSNLKQAQNFAWDAHQGQEYKPGIPYWFHPLRVSLRINRRWHKYPKVYEIVAMLHDVIEDTDVTYEDILREFGQEVADAVLTLSRDKENETYFEYIERLLANDIAVIVKEADLKENMANFSAKDYEKPQHGLITRYKKAINMLWPRYDEIRTRLNEHRYED